MLTYCLVANRKKEWAKKTKQLFSLVLSDLFASIVMIPQTIFTKLNVERTYELCAAFNFSVATTQTISCHHILSLCIHRWVQIRRVHLPSNTDTYRYNLESCVIWISLVLISMPPYYFWGRHGHVMSTCDFMDLFEPSDRPAMIYLLVMLCLPWFLTNAIYVAMVLQMMSTRRVQPSSGKT